MGEMVKVTYQVVEHDGGWAYKVGDVFSETFASHELAQSEAHAAAQRQQVEGAPTIIEFEDEAGHWHKQVALGGDRPQTEVVDEAQEENRPGREGGSLSRDVGADEPLPDGPNS
jgi:hypothetical protein